MGGVVILSSTAVSVWGIGGVDALDSSSSPTRTAYVTTVPYGQTNTAQRPSVGLLYPRYSRPFVPAG